ncbi:hypothetical protein M501DRAFT_996864, partial [Patellaria atrata CBS 101060]
GNVEIWVLWWICQLRLSVRCQPRSSMEHEKVSLHQLFVSSSTYPTISTDISTAIRYMEIWIRVLRSSSVYIEIPLVDR